MLPYLLKSAACLAILLLFYKIFLERENMHQFKRFYLLISLVACFAFPLVTFTQYVEVEPIATPAIQNTEFDALVFDSDPQKQESMDLTMILWATYFLGVLIFTVKFVRNLYGISKRIKNGQKLREKIATKVLHQEKLAPHTFLRYIFLNRNRFEAQKIPKEVLLHEEAHVVQRHSLDILFVELLQVALWFNPLFYWIKHLIKTNHEFLADKSVTQQTKSTQNYQHLLLTLSSSGQEPSLANLIRYSSIEKRLLAMKKRTSRAKTLLLGTLILPLFALLIYSFSTTNVVEKEVVQETEQVFNETKEQKTDHGVSDALMQEYRELVKATKTSKGVIIKFDDYERATAIYALMSDAQRASVEKYPKIPSVNLGKTEKRNPTIAQLESWKNKHKFAIWIDGQHVPNSELDKYTVKDIVHYAGSFVYNNARSEKFPQAYQFHLYTAKGFENTYQMANLNNYRRLAQNFSERLKTYIEIKNEKSYSELRIAHILANQAYSKLTPGEIKKYQVKKLSPLPHRSVVNTFKTIAIWIDQKGTLKVNSTSCEIDDLKSRLLNLMRHFSKEQKNNLTIKVDFFKETPNTIIFKVKETLRDLGVLKINFSRIPSPTIALDTIYTYNRLAKRIMTISKNRKANIIYLKEIYSKLNSSQKSRVKEPNQIIKSIWPQDKANAEMISQYNLLAKKYNEPSQKGRHIPNWDLDLLESIYNIMSDSQRKNAEPFPSLVQPQQIESNKEEKDNSLNSYAPKLLELSAKDSLTIPPVTPTIAYRTGQVNYSQKLKTSIQKYAKKSKAYEAKVKAYITDEAGSLEELWGIYSETMELYAAYYALAREEGNFVQPVPAYKERNKK